MCSKRRRCISTPGCSSRCPGVIAADGHSDYESAFRRFLDGQGHALRPGTTVIIAGDGRTNYRPAGSAPFREICQRVRRVYWFNPEPTDEWGTDDSAVPLYRPSCTGVFEVRSLTQLGDAIADNLVSRVRRWFSWHVVERREQEPNRQENRRGSVVGEGGDLGREAELGRDEQP